MPDEWDQHAGALEHTQDNRTIILGRYNDSAIMYGCEYYIIDKVKSVWRACPLWQPGQHPSIAIVLNSSLIALI